VISAALAGIDRRVNRRGFGKGKRYIRLREEPSRGPGALGGVSRSRAGACLHP
jgi:hypothetical protein